MPINVCTHGEKVVRLVIGLALLSLLFFLDGGLALLGLIGLIPIVTVLISYCPIKHLFGITSCKIDTHRAHHA